MKSGTKLWTLLIVAALASLALVAAACGEDEEYGDGGQPGGGSTPLRAGGSPQTGETSVATRPADTPTSAAAGATTINVAEVASIGKILTDAAGKTLYTFKNDTAGSGTSACTGACNNVWPALIVTGDPVKPAEAPGEIGTITLADGRKQVTYKGQPLYRYVNDTAPGQTNGHGIANIWFAAQP